MSYASNEHILINTNLILRINMFAFNPLASILSNNRFDGTNYVSWKRNLNIVLTCEGIIWVTLESLHVAPIESSTPEERADYEAWRKDDEEARIYILASLNEVLQSQHQSMSTLSAMLLSLQEMFETLPPSFNHFKLNYSMNKL